LTFGADLGTDQIWAWRLDPALGTLVPHTVPTMQVASGSGARHLVFTPDGRFVYVISELASSVTAFSFDASRGTFTWLETVSTLPRGFTGTSACGEIAVHPSGRYLYGSNRGADTIVCFRIDQSTGRLDPVDWTPTGGLWPRSFAIDPTGELLLVGNQNSNGVSPFRIERNGRLRRAGDTTTVASPACIAFQREVLTG